MKTLFICADSYEITICRSLDIQHILWRPLMGSLSDVAGIREGHVLKMLHLLRHCHHVEKPLTILNVRNGIKGMDT